ncbi:cation diffusion facilitator family transporter [Methanobacterium sp. ACI-7]|uniref:cation diffusion facilitator family transporter n=1 Tax=Methanobacterium sp. ACI-7 TaxID=3240853 RepID=UPI0039C1D69F
MMRDDNYYLNVKRVLIIILILNIFVAVIKGFYGSYTNSLSMISDGFHSLFDSTSNIIGLIGISIASRPPDTNHPYGYNKVETFASIGIAFLLFITCFELIQSAFNRYFTSETPEITVLSFLIMIITIGINIGVSRYENKKGNQFGSSILISDSLHTRSDVYASISVIIGFIAIELGYTFMDSIIAVFIAILIALMGIRIIKQSSNVLIDKAPVDENLIKKLVNSMDHIKGCHKIRTRGSKSFIFVDLHIMLDSCYDLNDAHTIAHEVEEKLKNTIRGIEDVVVHVDPCDED